MHKKVAGVRVKARFTSSLSATNSLQICREYKLWIYRNYIIPLLRFTLCVDSVSVSTISQLESTATRYLKKWLNLPLSATRVLLYYPGICCPSITQVSREAKLSLLSCVSVSSDSRLQELGLQLQLGNVALQIRDTDYSLLMRAHEQLSSLPTARSLYMKAKKLLSNNIKSNCNTHLQTLTVQCKFADSAQLEDSCKTWNRLIAGFNPGQLSFLLRAASDTLPKAVNLRRWRIQSDVHCMLCASSRPTTAHILGGCLVALTQQRYTYRHDKVLYLLASWLVDIFVSFSSIQVYADIHGLQTSEGPQGTVPSSLLFTPYRPDIVVYNSEASTVALLELTCPLDSEHHIQEARSRKQNKTEYLQLLSEFDRLQIPNYYETVEISVLGHYLPSSIHALKSFIDFTQPSIATNKTDSR